MKKAFSIFLLATMLLASCVPDVEASSSSRSKMPKRSSSISSSVDFRRFGDDPASIYTREERELVTCPKSMSTVAMKYLTEATRSDSNLFLNVFLHDENAWANVDVVSQNGIIASVRGLESAKFFYPYYDESAGGPLTGTSFKGMPGDYLFEIGIPEEACRNPKEAYFKIVFVAKEDITKITGYALAVVYPFGDSVEARSEDAPLKTPFEERDPGPVWLNWRAEMVCSGVYFPMINGEYQDVKQERVDAALGIMVENAAGRYYER